MSTKYRYSQNKSKQATDENKKKAYGYIRVSDISQIERSSLMTQTKAIMKYCEENGLELENIFKDEGKSGRSTDGRDDFLELMRIVEPGNFVIVYELSRFSRDLKDIMDHFRNLVRNKGCVFISLNPHIDSRLEGSEFMIGVMGSVAQQESDRTSIRVKANMRRLADEGKLLCRPPFGYIHNPETRRYEEDPEQQEVLKQLELWFLGGISMNEMAKRLNKEGKGHVMNNNKKKKIEDAKFSVTTIASILRGYGIIKDEKTPKFTYKQRVENWNNSFHKSKVTREETEQ